MPETLPTCYGEKGDPHAPTEMESAENEHHPSQVRCPSCGVIVDAAGYMGEP